MGDHSTASYIERKNRKKIYLSLGILLSMAVLLFGSRTALAGARRGLLLWYRTLFPTLMPFMVLSNLIVLTGAARYIGRLLYPVTRLLRLPDAAGYCILVGLLCGYPMGAYVCSTLNAKGELSDKDMDYLAPVCNNVSPMFMISYIAIECLKTERMILPVMGALFAGTLISMAALRGIRFVSDRKGGASALSLSTPETADQKHDYSVAGAFNASVMNAINASLKLCIFVMLFSIIGSYLGEISFLPDAVKAGMMSLCEITAGLDSIAALNMDVRAKYVFMVTVTAFGGLSSVFQTMSLAEGNHFSVRKYIGYKLFITAVTFGIALLAALRL